MGTTSGGQGFPTIAPNSLELPYAVRTKGWDLAGAVVLYGAGVIAGLVLVAVIFGERHGTRPGAVLPGLLGGVAAAACAWRLWLVRTPYAVFHSDRLEVRGILGWRSLWRSQIGGVGKTLSSRYGTFFFVYPDPGAGNPIRLNGKLRADNIVASWLAGAPDPEAEAIKADRAGVLADSRYGATETERARRLDLAKKAMLGFNLLCAGAGIWLGLFGELNPISVGLAAAALVVGAVIVATSNGLVVWIGNWKARPGVVGAPAPILGLAAHAGFTVHLLEPGPLTLVAVVVAIAAVGLLLVRSVSPWGGARTTPWIGFIAGLAAYGGPVLLDVAFDTSKSRTFPTVVQAKHVSRGRSTTYYLDLGPWNGRPAGEVSVSSAFYDQTDVGNAVCIAAHDGALRLGWFDVNPCPPGVQAPAPTQASTPFYPEQAERQGVEGSAIVECSVGNTLSLTNCRAVSETPAGYGFGAAAVGRVQSLGPRAGGRASTPGVFRTRVSFKLAG